MENIPISDLSLVRQLESPTTYNFAASQIVERYITQLRGLIQRNLTAAVQKRVDPEDVAQSTWRSFFRCRRDFEIDESLFPILAKIAKRKVARAVRRHTAEKRDMRREATNSSGFDTATLRAMCDGSTAAEAIFVMEAIGTLPEELQTIVILRLDGHTYEEIACQMGVTKRTIHRKKDIAQDLLKEVLNVGSSIS